MTATNNARAIGASRFTFHASRTACQKSRLTLHVSRFTQSLLAPIDIASLAAFRFLFGLVMAGAMIRFMAKGWVRELYLAPALHFPYPGFEWIRPWPDALMYAHFISLVVLALGVALGIFYRVCAMLFFLGFTYVELLDQTAHLNHYYLISLLAGLLIVLPAHRAWTVDAWRKPRLRADLVPAWCLNILRFQIGVVYVFAGLAKFNADWLFRAQPLRIWLAARSDLPLIGHWLDQFWVACAASWFGAIFDASIVFFLLHRRTRRAAYIVLILFHVATWALFNIGMFPWIMIIAATVFLPPDWPRYWLKRISGKWIDEYAPPPVHTLSRSYAPTLVRSHALTLILALYVMVQLALPLRPWFSSQPSAWTCSGFNCAWRVMIAEKTGYAEFFACDPATGNRWRVSVQDYISQRQETMVAQDPYLIRTMGRRLADDLSREAGRPIQVTATSFATLNGRPSQQLINPNFDLAGPSGSGWIMPLAPLHKCVSRSAAVAK